MNNNFEQIASLMHQSSVGKHLPHYLYVHVSALNSLDSLVQEYEQKARKLIDKNQEITLVKFSLIEPKISYLVYPDFDRNPHPLLQQSTIVNLENSTTKTIDYRNSENPPILHRKETFVTKNYPLYNQFSHLTDTEEKLGLLDNSRYIGTKQGWEKLLIILIILIILL